MVTTRAFALRDAGERHACQMLFEGGWFRCRPPFLFLHTKRPARFAKSQLSCRSFVQLRQQESNLRFGSQSPLRIHLYFIVFMLFIRRIFNCSHLISHPIFVKCFFRTLLNLFSVTNYRDNQYKFLVQNVSKCLDSSKACRYNITRTRSVQTGRNPEYEVRL